MYAKNARGSTLMEALIALILIAILLNGAGYLATRATSSHTDQQLLSIAITQMRASLRNDDICTTAPVVELPNGNTLPTLAQGCDTTTATIGGHIITDVPTPLGLSVESDLLGGQVVVGGTWRR